MDHSLSYLIIGTGGTGGPLGCYLAKAGFPVTFIARGKQLAAMQKNGLRCERPQDAFTINPMQACDMDTYAEAVRRGEVKRPDVIFVCVKGYSIDSTYDFIRAAAGPDTVVIPILNIYGTGGVMQEHLPGILVTDGCIYVAALIKEPGVILMKGEIMRVIYGTREPLAGGRKNRYEPILKQVEKDLNASGILGVCSENIRRDALLKFSYVSPQGAVGLYYGVESGAIQREGKERESFRACIREIDDLAHAMGIRFTEDIVARNLKILDDLAPNMTTSLQRDIAAGKQSEIDGLIYGVVRMGDRYGIAMPEYRKIAAVLRQRYENERCNG